MMRTSMIVMLMGLLAGAPPLFSSTVVQEGIVMDLSVQRADGQPGPLLAGDSARVRFSFRDTASGTPLSNLYPGAWMDLLGSGLQPGADCNKKVESFIGGALLSRPTLDLNVYYVLALNHDATISVVDPLFGYGGSQLLAMVFLKSPGEDWALTTGGDRLFVSMPGSNRVAVVESAAPMTR